MSRYVAIPNAWASETHVPDHRPSCEVFETDTTPVATGLLDADGTPLYRLQDRVALGFYARTITS